MKNLKINSKKLEKILADKEENTKHRMKIQRITPNNHRKHRMEIQSITPNNSTKHRMEIQSITPNNSTKHRMEIQRITPNNSTKHRMKIQSVTPNNHRKHRMKIQSVTPNNLTHHTPEVQSVNTNTQQGIPNSFIIKRIDYLCNKSMVLFNNNKQLTIILDNIIMLSKIYKINNMILRHRIRNFIIEINEKIFTSPIANKGKLVCFDKLETICNLYNITESNIINEIKNNIEIIKSKTISFNNTKSTLNNTTNAHHSNNSTNQTSSNNLNAEDDLEINKLYYEKIYEIILQMKNQIGDASDQEKINWIFNYVLNMKYEYPPLKSYVQDKDNNSTGYNPNNAKKKINSKGTVFPENSLAKGKFFNGVFSKYNLIFSPEKSGVCSAKAFLVVDLLDFCLNENNYCIEIGGYHSLSPIDRNKSTGSTHSWNAIINKNGVYQFDTSANWHGKNNQYLQSMEDPGIFGVCYQAINNLLLYNTNYFTNKNITSTIEGQESSQNHRSR